MAGMGCVICLGSINGDVQARGERWPGPGETAAVQDLRVAGGGKAANIAYFSRRLGAAASLVARTGDDAFAGIARSGLDEAGVDLRWTRALPGQRTGTALILVGAGGAESTAIAPGAAASWGPDDIAEAAQAVRAAPDGSILVCDLQAGQAAVAAAAAAARARGFPILLDPSPADRAQHLLAGLDYLTPDAQEARTLTGMAVHGGDAALQAGERLLAQGVHHALVKLPHGGCAAVARHAAWLLRAPPVTPVDQTGAGDAFAAGLAVGLLRGLEFTRAAALAVAASTVAVSSYGAQAHGFGQAAVAAALAGVQVARA